MAELVQTNAFQINAFQNPDSVIDVQVGTSADDGVAGNTFDATGTTIAVGKYPTTTARNAWYRFSGITIPKGSTVGANTTLTHYESGSVVVGSGPLTIIYAEDANNPASPGSAADYAARTTTTQSVNYNGDPGANAWYTDINVQAIVQELVTSYDYSTAAIMFLHKDNGSTAAEYQTNRSYDNTTSTANTWGFKLHIEYTPPAGGKVPVFMATYRRRRT